MSVYALLADAILVLHLAIVLFIAGGLLAVWIGHALGRGFVRNRGFRLTHLGAMAFVALESLVGVICPLTLWEDQLRLLAGEAAPVQRTFMQRLLHPILFYDLPPAFFTTAYVIVLVLVVATYRWVRPMSGRQSNISAIGGNSRPTR